MLTLHGFKTQNTLKTLYVLEELACDYDFVFVDLFHGEQNAEPFINLTPVRKAPVLQVDDDSIFESGAICRYLANVENSTLYPQDAMKRAKVDQWMDFFSCHLGRWINEMYFEKCIRPEIGAGDPDEKALEEALKWTEKQLAIVNGVLDASEYLCGSSLTIADLFAFAYAEQLDALEYSLDDYPNVRHWLAKIESKDSISNGRGKLSLTEAA